VLIVAGGVIGLGLVVNLIVTFLSDGPGSALRWLVPPGIALIVAMALALADAAAPKPHRPSRLDVSVIVAIVVVLVTGRRPCVRTSLSPPASAVPWKPGQLPRVAGLWLRRYPYSDLQKNYHFLMLLFVQALEEARIHPQAQTELNS
jgi:hypothetical protein